MSLSICRVGLFVIVSAVLASSVLGTSRASAIIELIGSDPTIFPASPQPTVMFSTDIQYQLPSSVDLSQVSKMTLQFAENENPRPVDRVFFRYDFFHGDIAARGPKVFTLTDEGRTRTGIEQMTIVKGDVGQWNLRLLDTGAALPDLDYTKLCITITIGADTGSTCVRMINNGAVWMIP